MRSKLFACLFGIGLLASAPAMALTLSLTEGNRDLVDGSTPVTGTDAPNSPMGLVLGVVGAGATEYSRIDIHGRIVGAADFYTFMATEAFRIEFIFDDVFVNGSEITSGFVREGTGHNSSEFDLALNGGQVGNTTLITDIVSAADNGGTSVIFTGSAGAFYTFGIDNRDTDPSNAALYDIRISTIPLPAALPLFLVALGGLGLIARRRRQTT